MSAVPQLTPLQEKLLGIMLEGQEYKDRDGEAKLRFTFTQHEMKTALDTTSQHAVGAWAKLYSLSLISCNRKTLKYRAHRPTFLKRRCRFCNSRNDHTDRNDPNYQCVRFYICPKCREIKAWCNGGAGPEERECWCNECWSG